MCRPSILYALWHPAAPWRVKKRDPLEPLEDMFTKSSFYGTDRLMLDPSDVNFDLKGNGHQMTQDQYATRRLGRHRDGIITQKEWIDFWNTVFALLGAVAVIVTTVFGWFQNFVGLVPLVLAFALAVTFLERFYRLTERSKAAGRVIRALEDVYPKDDRNHQAEEDELTSLVDKTEAFISDYAEMWPV